VIVRRRLSLALAAIVIATSTTITAVASGVVGLPGAALPARPTESLATEVAAASLFPTSTPPFATPTPRPIPTLNPYPALSLDAPRIAERLQGALDLAREDLAAPGVVASIVFPDGHQWTGVSVVADAA